MASSSSLGVGLDREPAEMGIGCVGYGCGVEMVEERSGFHCTAVCMMMVDGIMTSWCGTAERGRGGADGFCAWSKCSCARACGAMAVNEGCICIQSSSCALTAGTLCPTPAGRHSWCWTWAVCTVWMQCAAAAGALEQRRRRRRQARRRSGECLFFCLFAWC